MGDQSNKDDRAGATQGRLAHRINNAVSYVVTNLNLVLEELDSAQGPSPATLQRVRQLVVEAAGGADRVADLVRELRVLDYGTDRRDDTNEDTWDDDRQIRRVLVVDDEPFILASIRRALHHYDVVVAEGGRAGVEALTTSGPFDLVLCDLVMPGVNGQELFRWITVHKPELAERVVFMTAGAFLDGQREFLHSVSNPVLHKPFDTKTLRWVLAQSLRRARGDGVTPA